MSKSLSTNHFFFSFFYPTANHFDTKMVLMLIIESQKINTNNKAPVKSVFGAFVNKSF